MTHTFRKIIRWLGYLFITFLVLIIIAFAVSRLLTPYFNRHLPDFDQRASKLFHAPVQIERAHLTWSGIEPELTLEQVKILNAIDQKPMIVVKQIKLNFNIFESLFKWQPLLEKIKISGTDFIVRELSPGELDIGGFYGFSLKDNMTGASLKPNDVLRWIFLQPKLSLSDIHVLYISEKNIKQSFLLDKLVLRNTNSTHSIKGKAALQQDIPTYGAIEIKWFGNIDDLAHASANFYLSLDAVTLAQWFKKQSWYGWQVTQGTADIRLWATWKENAWKTVHSQFQGENLFVKSQTTNEVEQFGRLNAELNWDGKQGDLKLDSQDAIFSYHKIFENPLKWDKISGEFKFNQQLNNSWMIDAKNIKLNNKDLFIGSIFSVQLSQDNLPIIDLTVNYSVVKAAHITNYLPLALMNLDLKKWLKQAFLSGQIQSGTLLLKGDLKNFPFDDEKKGKFLIRNQIKNLEFNFAPGWPVIHQINGELDFSDGTMTADVDSGFIYDVPLKKVHAVMTNIGVPAPTILSIKGIIQSDLSKGLYFLRHSPLEETVGHDLAGMGLSGPMELNLSLNIPLAKPNQVAVDGKVVFPGAVLAMPAWNLIFDKMHGQFQFTENDINAKDLQGQLWGENAALSFSTQVSPNHQKFVAGNLKSQISVEALQKWLNMPLSSMLQGKTNYTAELALSAHGSNQPTHITIHSNLLGISLNAIAPYGKAANAARDFKLDIFVKPDQSLQNKINYAGLLTAALTSKTVKNNLKIVSGEIHLGSGDANWQTDPGLIITGNLDELNWDTIKENKSSDWWRAIDVTINKLTMMGQQFNQTRVQVSKENNKWQIGLTNQMMQGQITLPMSASTVPVQARFQRLYFASNVIGDSSSLNPRNVPAFSFVGEDVRYGDKKLGRVSLDVFPHVSGLAIKKLQFSSPLFYLNAAGSWKLMKNQSLTYLQGEAGTKEISTLLTSWGYQETNLVGSDANAKFNLNWIGSPVQLTLSKISGNFSMRFGKGRVIDLGASSNAKLDIGRMLSILNLQTIPRRLSLDFSDLFEKGYSFDFISGDFSLKNGNAYTENMRLDGPVARVDILGRIGLSAKDYDLHMNITPYVTSSLPVVATIAGGPIAGALAWVADKAMSKAVSNVTTYHYKVTGPWDKPSWESSQR